MTSKSKSASTLEAGTQPSSSRSQRDLYIPRTELKRDASPSKGAAISRARRAPEPFFEGATEATNSP